MYACMKMYKPKIKQVWLSRLMHDLQRKRFTLHGEQIESEWVRVTCVRAPVCSICVCPRG